MRITDDSGKSIDAEFDVEQHDGHIDLILHARGGTRGTSAARNVEYAAGLALLLERATMLGGRVLDAVLDTSRVSHLPRSARRLKLDASYPIDLATAPDKTVLGAALRKAQLFVSALPGGPQRGGNSTRRIRLCVDVDAALAQDLAGIERVFGAGLDAHVSGPAGISVGIARAAAMNDVDPAFNPGTEADARLSVYRSIALRQGQSAFRRTLMNVYHRRCAITGCGVYELLDAAHVLPYRGAYTNHVQNGLLLRTDIHTLFDRGMLAIEAAEKRVDTWRVAIAPSLRKSEYAKLSGVVPRVSANEPEQPSFDAVRRHRSRAAF